MRITRLNAAALLAAGAAIGGAGLAVGAATSDPVTACAVKAGRDKGAVRLVASGSRCRKGERRVSWNKQGVPGLPGAQGAAGPTGPTGAPGFSRGRNQGLFRGSSGMGLEAGGWYVSATVSLRNSTDAPVDITCRLIIGDMNPADIKTVTVAPRSRAVLPLQQIHHLNDPGVMNATCDGNEDYNGLIVGLSVGILSEI